jgi:voltage-gated potassium channel
MNKIMNKEKVSKGFIILFLVLMLLTVGTAGYMLLAGASLLDGLYMTIITVSTVGYREIADLTPAAKVFTMLVILSGLGIVSYALLEGASFLIEGGVKQIVRRKSMKKLIEGMENHVIVCGAGQTGASVIEQFRIADAQLVVIEQDAERAAELEEAEVPVICGDASSEDVLNQAGIMRSKGMICCLDSDADNVYTVLTARGLNPKLHIVARSIEKGADLKLRRAGADNTISPNELGGVRMASLMLRPQVVSFLDIITRFDEEILDLGEVSVEEGAEIDNLLLKDARIPEKTGLIIIALRRIKGKMRFNPGPQERLSSSCSMLVLGKTDQIERLRKMASSPES